MLGSLGRALERRHLHRSVGQAAGLKAGGLAELDVSLQTEFEASPLCLVVDSLLLDATLDDRCRDDQVRQLDAAREAARHLTGRQDQASLQLVGELVGRTLEGNSLLEEERAFLPLRPVLESSWDQLGQALKVSGPGLAAPTLAVTLVKALHPALKSPRLIASPKTIARALDEAEEEPVTVPLIAAVLGLAQQPREEAVRERLVQELRNHQSKDGAVYESRFLTRTVATALYRTERRTADCESLEGWLRADTWLEEQTVPTSLLEQRLEAQPDGRPVIESNRRLGAIRHRIARHKLERMYPQENGFRVLEERALLARNKAAKDPLTGEGRRLDLVVVHRPTGQAVLPVEVTSEGADKTAQLAKERRIREGRSISVTDPVDYRSYSLPPGLETEIWRIA